MENQFMLPIGIEDFKEIREEGYYYVDKTALIEQVLEKRSKVTCLPGRAALENH